MIEIKSFEAKNTPLFEEARKIRDVVFVIEQEVDERDEFDEFEEESLHYLLFDDNKPIGTARWRTIGSKVKLERFAILKEARGKGLGEVLVKRVVEDASKEKKEMYLHAQLRAITLYKRCGFKTVGNLFSECNIDHYKMIYGALGTS